MPRNSTGKWFVGICSLSQVKELSNLGALLVSQGKTDGSDKLIGAVTLVMQTLYRKYSRGKREQSLKLWWGHFGSGQITTIDASVWDFSSAGSPTETPYKQFMLPLHHKADLKCNCSSLVCESENAEIYMTYIHAWMLQVHQRQHYDKWMSQQTKSQSDGKTDEVRK